MRMLTSGPEVEDSSLQKMLETDEDYRHFNDLLHQAAAHRTWPLEALEDDGSRARALSSFQKYLPLQVETYRRYAYSLTLNELAELSFFKLRDMPVYEAVAFSQEYVQYYRTKWRGYHDFHPALTEVKQRMGVQTDMRLLSAYYPYYHLWETLMQFHALQEKPAKSVELYEALLFTHQNTWIEARGLDFILEKALRLWGASDTALFAVRRHKEASPLPIWLLSRYLEELDTYRYAPISWWLSVNGWEPSGS